jgi:DnaJ family protein C protein 2
MYALPYGDDEDNMVYSSYTLTNYLYKKIEPAGKFFEEYAQRKLNSSYFDDLIDMNVDKDLIIEEDQEEYEWEKEYKEECKNVDIISSTKENYYAILGIEELFLNATADDVRKSYKKLALLYHPDKNKENNALLGDDTSTKLEEQIASLEENKVNLTEEEKKKIEINKKWLTIKNAYETLLDPEKRKKYDSTFEFDDTIPEEDNFNEKTFFKAFGPCFLKNSIWSKKKPIPKIGDMNTPLNRVKIFYQFWFNFDTWRDFSVEGEYNLEDAQSRYEKRAMLKENKKMKSSQIKEEKSRLTKLVNLAYKNDPRIRQEEERLRVEREKQRQERLIQKQKEKEAEEERIRQMKKEHEENLKRQQERLVKERQELTAGLFALAEELGIQITKEDKFLIELNANIEKLKTIITQVATKESQADKLRIFVNLSNANLGLKLKSEVVSENTIWKKDEIIALQKAVKKFPAGTKDRWDKISELVKTKSSNLIIQMTHYLTVNPMIKIESDIVSSFYNNLGPN